MKIAVIGAGASGIAATKICLDYGFQVVCFEKLDNFGGLWRFKPKSVIGDASIMKSTIINTSKELMAFSDFPPPAGLPNYMHHSKILKYFTMYVERFDLRKFIRFNTEVELIKRSANYDQTGCWDVTYKANGDINPVTETFDSVLLATGHHAFPYFPKLEGTEHFKGRIIHSHSYKDHVGFEDRKVLVIGLGNSGGDIAVELGRVASQVVLSTRTGCWCLSRVASFGKPLDMCMMNRFYGCLFKYAPWFFNSLVELCATYRFNHQLYGLACKYRVFNQHPMVNDDLPNRIISGTVIVKPNITRFLGNYGVQFDDGSEEYGIDDVIMCTGYDIAFPVLEKELIKICENQLDLYKFMYPPQLARWPTLCIVGLVQPWGAIMPISEMQVRFHCEVLLKNLGKEGAGLLPNQVEMQRHIDTVRVATAQRYGASRRHTVQVDFVPYMDDLAQEIGVNPPSIWRCAFVDGDWTLAWNLAFGPAAPYQYRLHGTHSWSGARNTLLTTWDRALAQMRAGRRGNEEDLKISQKFNFVAENSASVVSSLRFAIFLIIYALISYYLLWFYFETK